MIIITGIGRSGTSFTAKLLSEAGTCLKGVWFNKDIKAGMELDAMALLNSEIIKGNASTINEAITNLGIEDIKPDLSSGIYYKDPRFLLTINEWLESDYDIEHIIYCKRDYREIYDSSISSGHGMAGDPEAGIVILTFSGFVSCFSYMEKMFFHAVKQAAIPITILEYPQSVLNYSEIEKLSSLIDADILKDAWEKVRDTKNIRKSDHEFASTKNMHDVLDIRISELKQCIVEKDSIIAKQKNIINKYESKLIYLPWLKKLDQAFRKKIFYPVKEIFNNSKVQ